MRQCYVRSCVSEKWCRSVCMLTLTHVLSPDRFSDIPNSVYQISFAFKLCKWQSVRPFILQPFLVKCAVLWVRLGLNKAREGRVATEGGGEVGGVHCLMCSFYTDVLHL